MRKSQNQTLNLLKVLSMVGVVANHLFYPIFSRTDFYLGTAWWISLVFYTFSLVSVPLFIIINGYLLINKKEKAKKTINRITNRLVVPAVFWLVFYYLWKYNFRTALHIFEDITKVVASGSWFHYYFLIALMGLQALLPVFRMLAKQKRKFQLDTLKYLFVVGILLHVIEYVIDIPGSINNIFSWWMPFAGYFWLGYIVKKQRIGSGLARNLFVVWSMFNLLLSYLGMNIKNSNTLLGWHDSGIFYWHSFLSPNIIIMAVALFIWAINSKSISKMVRRPLVSRIISFLAPISYGVYLVHAFVIDWVDIRLGYAIEFVSTSLSSFVVQRTLLVFIISYAVSFIITKLPFTRWAVGMGKSRK